MSDTKTTTKAGESKDSSATKQDVKSDTTYVKLISPFDDGNRVHPVGAVLRKRDGSDVYPKTAKPVTEAVYIDYQSSLKNASEMSAAEARELMKKEVIAEVLAMNKAAAAVAPKG